MSCLRSSPAFSRRLGPAATALRPAVRELDPATSSLLPLAREGTPIVRDRLRPLTRVAPAELRDLGAAARNLGRAGPNLTTSVGKLNRLLKELEGWSVAEIAQAMGWNRKRVENELYKARRALAVPTSHPPRRGRAPGVRAVPDRA